MLDGRADGGGTSSEIADRLRRRILRTLTSHIYFHRRGNQTRLWVELVGVLMAAIREYPPWRSTRN